LRVDPVGETGRRNHFHERGYNIRDCYECYLRTSASFQDCVGWFFF